MISTWFELFCVLRQLFVPPQFRLAVSLVEPHLLAGLLQPEEKQAEEKPADIHIDPPTRPPVVTPPPPAVELGFSDADIVRLANEVHRLRLNQTQIGDPTVRRRVEGGLDRLTATLAERGIEIKDLTGEEYHPGRRDFAEPPEPELVPALRAPTILRCTFPAVFVGGRIVSPAKGSVGMPA